MTDATNNSQEMAPENQDTGVFSILVNLITSPQQAYQAMKFDYPILFPLMIFIVLMITTTILYMTSVDYEWFVEQQVEMMAGDKSKAEQDLVRAQFDLMSPLVQSLVQSAFLTIGYIVMFCAYSGYYVINSGINNDGYDFKQWFSFIAWAWIPKCIMFFMAIVIILISDNGQIPQDSLNPTSLNYLFFELSPASGLGSLFSMIDLGTVWSWIIMTIGYQVWTKSSIAKSAFITLLPYIVIYGIWGFIAA